MFDVCCKTLKHLDFIQRITYEFKLLGSRETLYCALIRPVLEYGSIIRDILITIIGKFLSDIISGSIDSLYLLADIDFRRSAIQISTLIHFYCNIFYCSIFGINIIVLYTFNRVENIQDG